MKVLPWAVAALILVLLVSIAAAQRQRDPQRDPQRPGEQKPANRTQYLLGYYPTNPTHDGTYRKIQVKTSRKDIAIRARPGYRARSGG